MCLKLSPGKDFVVCSDEVAKYNKDKILLLGLQPRSVTYRVATKCVEKTLRDSAVCRGFVELWTAEAV